jgi:Protein of unknown function (DUF2785)
MSGAVSRELPENLASLVDDLRSPDPQVRDEKAYGALARLVAEGGADKHLRSLGDAGAGLLGEDAVQARSFGALLIALVVERVNTVASGVPGGGGDAVRPIDVVRWLAVFLGWYSDEQDLRGHDDTLGWLHAVAHGADALEAFAGSALLHTADLVMLLDAVVARLHEPTTHHLTQQEDDRLGHAVLTVLARDAVPAEDALAWLDRLAQPWRDGTPGPTPAEVDNTIRFARTLHLQLTLGVRAAPEGPVLGTPDRDELLRHLGAALADVGWVYGRPQ